MKEYYCQSCEQIFKSNKSLDEVVCENCGSEAVSEVKDEDY